MRLSSVWSLQAKDKPLSLPILHNKRQDLTEHTRAPPDTRDNRGPLGTVHSPHSRQVIRNVEADGDRHVPIGFRENSLLYSSPLTTVKVYLTTLAIPRIERLSKAMRDSKVILYSICAIVVPFSSTCYQYAMTKGEFRPQHRLQNMLLAF